MSFLHDGVTTFTNLLGTGNTNPGLIQTANTSPLSGVTPNTNQILGQLDPGGVPLNFPTFKMPITDRENFLTNNDQRSVDGRSKPSRRLRAPVEFRISSARSLRTPRLSSDMLATMHPTHGVLTTLTKLTSSRMGS